MKRLLVILVCFIEVSVALAQTATPSPTPEADLHLDIVVEFESIFTGQHPQWFPELEGANTCVTGGTMTVSQTAFSGQYAVYYPGATFLCTFTFYGAGFGLRTYSGDNRRDIAVAIDSDLLFTIESGEGYHYRYVDLALGVHKVVLETASSTGAYTPTFDYLLLRTYAGALAGPGAEGTQAVEVTPDGATVYATVVFDEVDQVVAFRYQADAGQVMITILLAAILVLLLVMLIAQLRRRAPEP